MMIAITAKADALPSWITQGPATDDQYDYVVCSHDGLDPEDVKQVAEDKCLGSAAKLGGVTVSLEQKTIQSLTGSDSSEVAEIHPLVRSVRCEWTARYLEQVSNGIRVWLQCRVPKQYAPNPITADAVIKAQQNIVTPLRYKRAILSLTTLPQAEKVIIIGSNGERVIDIESNQVRIELKEGDSRIVVKKHKFKDATIQLKPWTNGDVLGRAVYLEQEL